MNILTYLRTKVASVARAAGASEEGATAAEYVFLLVFIAIVAAVGMLALGQGLDGIFDRTATELDSTTVPSLPDPNA